MPTIRDLVAAIRRRDGIAAAVVLGRDGLLIDHQADTGLDAENVAAHVPAILVHAEELGQAARQGRLLTAVHEFEGGAVVIAAMSNEAVLLVLLGPTADLGSLLFDLRRHRANIAALA
ncbi:MAG: roadblock/LC7 domain-containing protein [Gemmatimonadaceae bacterium]|nr:roadblock/LC7 domain-containing protein [Gemmatimonadaceae bacterium]